jgi:hypothetical protein
MTTSALGGATGIATLVRAQRPEASSGAMSMINKPKGSPGPSSPRDCSCASCSSASTAAGRSRSCSSPTPRSPSHCRWISRHSRHSGAAPKCARSPSSYNGQTTRAAAVTEGTGDQKRLVRMDFAAATESRYYAPVALGIWCADWVTGCQALGISGHFAVLTPQERGLPHAPELPPLRRQLDSRPAGARLSRSTPDAYSGSRAADSLHKPGPQTTIRWTFLHGLSLSDALCASSARGELGATT